MISDKIFAFLYSMSRRSIYNTLPSKPGESFLEVRLFLCLKIDQWTGVGASQHSPVRGRSFPVVRDAGASASASLQTCHLSSEAKACAASTVGEC